MLLLPGGTGKLGILKKQLGDILLESILSRSRLTQMAEESRPSAIFGFQLDDSKAPGI